LVSPPLVRWVFNPTPGSSSNQIKVDSIPSSSIKVKRLLVAKPIGRIASLLGESGCAATAIVETLLRIRRASVASRRAFHAL
jgi:hypothetical protein